MPENLFAQIDASEEPLAARMRPRTVDEFVGQQHILGPGRLLRRAIQADMLSSIIFYGPPGTGKTTLARVIANTTKSAFVSLNAVLAGVKDVRTSIAEAKKNRELYERRTILFVDEVHRWNKAQQDALLPWVENGTVVLVGATTQNPFFEVNSALVSRSRIFQLKALTSEDLFDIVGSALSDRERGYGLFNVTIDDDALEHLVHVADGDARALLNALQLAVETTPDSYPPSSGTEIHIDRTIAEDSIQKKAVLYDKEGDYHFDVISAFIKSLRGSDPDAALYWMAKMIHGGEDPRYVFRRMLIAASEDVGMADPNALVVVESAAAAYDRVGLPEGNFFLAHAAIYLATCPKSNSALGYFDALQMVAEEKDQEVPSHMRDASRDAEGFGHGEGYLYPHAYRDHWVAQAYLPKALQGRVFYEPTDQAFEATIQERVARRREIQLESGFIEAPDEILTYSRQSNRNLDAWIERAASDRTQELSAIRDAVVAELSPARHHRILLAGRESTLALWDAVRSVPEGAVWAVVENAERREIAEHYASRLSELERPVVIDGATTSLEDLVALRAGEPTEAVPARWRAELADGVEFERIAIINGLADLDRRAANIAAARELLSPGGRIVIAQIVPKLGQRLAALVEWPGGELQAEFEQIEDSLYSDPDNRLVAWDGAMIVAQAEKSGLKTEVNREIDLYETRTILARHLDSWLDQPDRGGLAAKLADLPEEQRAAIARVVRSSLRDRRVEWKSHYLISVAGASGATG